LLLLLIFALVQIPAVQTFLAQRAASYLSDELGTVVKIDRLSVNFPDRINLEGVFVEDLNGDTLLFVQNLSSRGLRYSGEKRRLDLGELVLNQPEFYLHRHRNDSIMNLDFISNYFASSDTSTSSEDFIVFCRSVSISDAVFEYFDFIPNPAENGLVDFDNLSIRGFSMNADTISVIGDSIAAYVHHFELEDHSGFKINELSGAAYVSSQGIIVNGSRIQSNETVLNGDLSFKSKSWSDWSEFVTDIKMDSRLDSSTVSFNDIAYFVPEFQGLNKSVKLEGEVKGSVSRMRGKNISLKWDDNSSFEGDFRLEGLPDFEQTFITLDLKRFTTNKAELDRFPLPPFSEGKTIQTPDNFSKLGQIEFSGNFTGFIDEFVAYGRIDTRIGRIISDISIRKEADTYAYSGDLSTDHFDLGKFYDQKLLGVFTSKLKVDGKGITINDADATLEGEITEFGFNDYAYRNIQVNGTLKKSFFDGALNIEDRNIKFDFLGTIDLTQDQPAIRARADIPYIDPIALNFLEPGVYSTLSGVLDINTVGLDIHTFTGSIEVKDFIYCHGDDEYNLDKVFIKASNEKKGRQIVLDSPIADVTIIGKYDYDGLQRSVLNILDQIFPSYAIPEYALSGEQQFECRVLINDFTPITELFLPEISIAPGTFLTMVFDEPLSKVELTASSTQLRILDYYIDSLTFDISRPDSAAYITLLSDKIQLSSGLSLQDFALDARSESDTIYSNMIWNSAEENHSGELNARINLRGNENFDVLFAESIITLNETPWTIQKDGFVQIDSTEIAVRRFSIEHNDQYIKADGAISENVDSTLNIEINQFNLSNINPFLADFNANISGSIDGSASVKDLYNEKKFLSDLIISKFSFNERDFGNFCLESSWDAEYERLILLGEIQNDVDFPLIFGGYYTPKNEESPLDIQLELTDFNLDFLNPFLTEGISELSGTIDAKAQLTGTFEVPLLDGSINFNTVGITIDYLGSTFYLNDKAGIYPDMFTLDYIEFKDSEGNVGHLIGTVAHDNFEDWNFDVYADLEQSKMLCLSTTKAQNPLYYGKAYASGFVSVFGYLNNLEFDINLKAEKGTVLNLPLGDPEELAFEDFVVFVNDDGEDKDVVDLSGIDLHFELDINPEAEFRLIFDEAAGDIMKGRGQGHLNMDITSEGIFEMYGSIEVVEGNYLFTLRNLINKEFQVEKGGTISWYGDPLGADLNLRTVYRLNAPLYDLMSEDAEKYRSRVPIDLIMTLKGEMLNPGINFDIELPASDDLSKSRVKSAISSEEERNRQAFALLVLRRFVSPPNVQNDHSAFGVAENSAEFLTSQFNNWLSQISEDFDIGFNYRPGDAITNSEVALALSTQLFNDRLSLSGNFGVNYGNAAASQNSSNIVGDVEIEYNITTDGRIRLIVFNRSNEYDVTQTDRGLNTQGLGVLYEEEFDTLDEFFCQIKQLFKKSDERIPCAE